MLRSINNIFIPVNFSEASDSAIYTGIAMCKRHHAALHLLYVESENTFIYPPGKKPGVSILMLEREMDRLNQLEAQAKRIGRENDIDCFFHTGKGVFPKVLATKCNANSSFFIPGKMGLSGKKIFL